MHYYSSSLYSSTYNGNYNNFYVNVFQNEIPYRNSVINGETNNLLYQIYMGEKYIITKKFVIQFLFTKIIKVQSISNLSLNVLYFLHSLYYYTNTLYS